MTTRRKTIRRLPPTARKLAEMANHLEMEARRLRALIPMVKAHEDVFNFVKQPRPKSQIDPNETPLACPTHGAEFHTDCTGCSDSFFGQGLVSLERTVSRDAPEVEP